MSLSTSGCALGEDERMTSPQWNENKQNIHPGVQQHGLETPWLFKVSDQSF